MREDELILDEEPEGSGRRLALKIAIALVVAALLLLGGLRWIDDGQRQEGTALPSATLVPGTTDRPDGSPLTQPADSEQPPAPSTTTVAAQSNTTVPTSIVQVLAPIPAEPSTSISSTTTPGVLVTAIQTVPAIRDFIVEIDGERLSSDSAGTIALPAEVSADSTVVLIGVHNEPPLWQVVFTTWSDGNTQTVRRLDSVPGPVATVGLLVSTRVIVTTQPPLGGEPSAVITTGQWEFTVPLDEPRWLPSARAVPSGDGLVEEVFTYTATALLTNDGTQVIAGQSFRATPEAVWVIAAGPSTTG
jgi:hypothetical protein